MDRAESQAALRHEGVCPDSCSLYGGVPEQAYCLDYNGGEC